MRIATFVCLIATVAGAATTPPGPPPYTAAGDGRSWIGSNQYLTEGQCLVSANKKWWACADDGNLKLTYPSKTGGAYFNTATTCCDSSYKGVFLVMQYDGNVALYHGPNPGQNLGLRWHANAPATPGPYFLTMQDDGNLCRYSGPDPGQNWGGGWCTQTGRYYVEQMLRSTARTPFNSDIAAALALFDSGVYFWVSPRHGDFTVSGGQCMLAQYGLFGPCVNRKASCWEVVNVTNPGRSVLLQASWSSDSTIRQWALLAPGQLMRFDNRGEGDRVWCAGCSSSNQIYVSDSRGTRWGNWPGNAEIWRKWYDTSFPPGCQDHLGLGSTH